MTISDLEFYLVEMEHGGRDTPIRSLLVRLATESGLEGWGETQLAWRVAELPLRRESLLAVLAGRSVFDVEDLITLEALRSAPLRSAVEMASWDLIGRKTGLPLCHFFGGGYRPRVPLAIRLREAGPAETGQLARELAEQGFHCQIATASGSVEADLEQLLAIAEAVGDRIELRFDGASHYDMPTARDLCSELGDDLLQFFLDPLAGGDLEQVAALGRQTNVPLAVSRAVTRPADVLAVVRSGAASHVVVDPSLVGGLASARRCAAITEAAGLHASLAGGPSSGIGLAAMLQLAASTPAFSGCNECAYHQLQNDLLVEPLEITDGMIAVPRGPGLGVEVARSKVERFQVS
jgi:L-alanine-DL-glutamate epimerase-like enolase superfamily enzyme